MRGIALAALLAASVPAQAQMYKCVDERGVTSYSDKPRPGCSGKEVDIRPIPPLSGQVNPAGSDIAQQEADFKRRQIERDIAEAKDKTALAQRKRQCERLKDEYAKLDGRRRLVVAVDAKGERTYMDDEAREKRRAEIREKLGACS